MGNTNSLSSFPNLKSKSAMSKSLANANATSAESEQQQRPARFAVAAPVKLAHGLLPPRYSKVSPLDRALLQLRSKTSMLEKYVFMMQLKDQDEDLFYKVTMGNTTEVIPVLYTPTVGDACLNFSHIYRRPDGLFISIDDKGKIGSILRSWPRREEARISVVTDGSRILGLGDLGVNGMPISIGKLSLYVAGAGIRPSSTMPICLDLGTNNDKFLADPLYLGRQTKRVSDKEMEEFMDEFMTEMSVHFPKLLVQFEDFSTDNAFKYLARFRNQYPVFNDDIQGTGAVVLGGFINAAKLSSAASGKPLSQHRILFFGAGSAGVGVAQQLMSFFKLQGLTEDQARECIWTVDSQGLITADRKNLPEHKKFFARKDHTGPPVKDLEEIINLVKPTALLGLSTQHGAFTEQIVKAMAAINPRPIIFPLSNPLTMCELDFQDAVKWTDGKVLFSSGSPYKNVEYGGTVLEPGQGNNMFVFPGIGLGSLLAQATSVTDSMIEASAIAVSESLTPDEKAHELMYPRITRIREISAQVALKVIRTAQAAGVDQAKPLRTMTDAQVLSFIQQKMWTP
ncbi:hypothetical protein FRB96_001287 [Tulasnella sp. 330]|nr:hypothetical protein FRB96_001287 [Tulasnella sp. 330]KAG8873144.1 hypothetical protein FRB97_006991 [Tulasnella sp. 331]KAG8876972.1 hypothetical protein FRB98_006941 [Tulasnella sp. 332]